MPASEDGMRIEPPPSVPMASGPRPAATAALAPPLEPPGVRSRFHGLRVGPKSRLWVAPIQPIIGVLVLPSWIAPAASIRSTIGALSAGTLSAKSRVPNVVRTPRVITRSLVENGTPCSGPRRAPFLPTARSAARAAFMACSAVRVTKAFRRGLSRSMRASTAVMTSTGEILRRLMAGAISDAGIQQRSSAALAMGNPLTLPSPPGERDVWSGAAQARIQRVAERVAQQVRAEDGQADREAGEQHEPRRLLRVLRGGDREHAAPRRIRLRHTQAQERQSGLDQDGAAELRGAEHDEGADGVGEDVAEGDAHVAQAHRARRLHVLHLPDREHA